MSDPVVHSQLADIQRTLGHLQGQGEAIIERLDAGSARMDAHDKRITGLERWRTWVAGISAGMGALFGAGSSHFPKL